MFSKFLSLEPEKQERILNAAIKEFAKKGFKNASTNEIVEEAGISKGLLFHYFKNKKDLYLFLYDYALEIFMNEFWGKINRQEKDVLIRLRHWAWLKIEIAAKHPDIFDFILAANTENAAEIKTDLEQRNRNIMQMGSRVLFENIDTSQFRDDIDISLTLNVMLWALEGFRNQKQQQQLAPAPLDYGRMLEEMDQYLNLFKKCFYN